MTSKDYKLVAIAIAALPPETTRYEVARYLALALEVDNPRFNAQRFIGECNAIEELPK